MSFGSDLASVVSDPRRRARTSRLLILRSAGDSVSLTRWAAAICASAVAATASGVSGSGLVATAAWEPAAPSATATTATLPGQPRLYDVRFIVVSLTGFRPLAVEAPVPPRVPR